MDREQPNRTRRASPDVLRSEREASPAGTYRATAERVWRWVADERDELDRVAVRTWN